MIEDLDLRLKHARNNKRLSQKQVSELLNVHRATVSSYERAGNTPSPEMLMKFAALYGVSVDYLLGIEKQMPFSVEGLTSEQIAALSHVADEFRVTNKLLDSKNR